MTVILVLLFCVAFLIADTMKTRLEARHLRGTTYTTPGFEMLGALAQDGGSTIESEAAETEAVMAKMKRTNVASAKQ